MSFGSTLRRLACGPVLLGLLGLLSACAQPPGPGTSSALCRKGPECPIELHFVQSGAGRVAVAEGELSPRQPAIRLAFQAPARSQLQWSLRGPAVRTFLTGPDGAILGPGLPATLSLPIAGRYEFGLSSNLMAEGIHGPFRLELRVLPPD